MPKKKPKLDLVKTSVNIEREQLKWLEQHHFNLSSLVRSHLRELIKSIEALDKKTIFFPVISHPKSASSEASKDLEKKTEEKAKPKSIGQEFREFKEKITQLPEDNFEAEIEKLKEQERKRKNVFEKLKKD